jgi:TonB family protein
MAIRAFLLCGDEKAVQAVTQILDELEISFEHSSEPGFSLKRLSTQKFELLVVDCDNAQNATQVFNSARASNLNKTSIAIAIVEGKAGVPNAFRLGASLVLTKPVSLEQARNTLRTGIGMTRKDAPEVKPAAPIVSATPHVPAPAAPSQTVSAAPPAPVRPSSPAVLTPLAPVAPTASVTPAKVVVPAVPVAEKPAVVPRPVVSIPAATAQDPKAGSTATTVSKPQPGVVGSSGAPKTTAAAAASTPAAKSSFDSMFTTPAEPEKDAETKSSAKLVADDKDSKESPRPLRVVDPLAEEDIVDPVDEHGVPSFGGLGKQPFAGMETAKHSSGGHGALIAAGFVLVLAAAVYGAWMTQPSFRKLVSWEYLNLMSKFAGGRGQQPTPVAAKPVTPPPVAAAQPQPAVAVNPSSDSTASASTQTAPSADSAAASNSPGASAQPGAAAPDNGAQKTAAVQPAKQDTTPNHPGANPSLVSASASLPSSDAVKPPSSDLLEVPEDYADDQVVHRVHPVYPKQAKARKLHGPVVLEAIVNKHGKVDSLQLVSGDPLLAQAAADAVKQWRYKPYSYNGEPSDFQTRVTVDFKLP